MCIFGNKKVRKTSLVPPLAIPRAIVTGSPEVCKTAAAFSVPGMVCPQHPWLRPPALWAPEGPACQRGAWRREEALNTCWVSSSSSVVAVLLPRGSPECPPFCNPLTWGPCHWPQDALARPAPWEPPSLPCAEKPDLLL